MVAEAGIFAEFGERHWLVAQTIRRDLDFDSMRISRKPDDAQGEQLEVIGAKVRGEDGWQRVGRGGPNTTEVSAACLQVVRWNSSKAAEHDPPLRAGRLKGPCRHSWDRLTTRVRVRIARGAMAVGAREVFEAVDSGCVGTTSPPHTNIACAFPLTGC